MMTKLEVVDLLRKTLYDENNLSTNLQHISSDGTWDDIQEFLAETFVGVMNGDYYRNSPEHKVAPFTREEVREHYGKMVRFGAGDSEHMVVGTRKNSVLLAGDVSINFEYFAKEYKFMDGSPCGRWEDA